MSRASISTNYSERNFSVMLFFDQSEEWSLLNFLKYLDSIKSLRDSSEPHRKYGIILNGIKNDKNVSQKKGKELNKHCQHTREVESEIPPSSRRDEKRSSEVREFWQEKNQISLREKTIKSTERMIDHINTIQDEASDILVLGKRDNLRQLKSDLGVGNNTEDGRLTKSPYEDQESDDDFMSVRQPKRNKQLSLPKKAKTTKKMPSSSTGVVQRGTLGEAITSPEPSLSSSENVGSSSEMTTSGTDEANSSGYNRPHTPPHQIDRNKYNQELSINENILIMSAKNLANLDESKQYLGEFIPLFVKYKESEEINTYSCANDDVMDIRGESGFAKFLSIDQFIKLLSKKPSRKVKLPEDWRNIIEEYYKELNVVKKDDTEEMTKLKDYLNRVMLPLIESFAKPIPDVNASNINEHHYWAEFGHRFFSRALQEFVDLDWRIMEVPVLASKYRKNYGHDHAIDK
ncbi:17507_t:CDS:10, partial [Acaulospora morrowiae]